ncbi:Glycoprotein-N-acetylgalactosamine 3-beta-galactosyltransferase 1 [Operophtera brumata]|uniref:Glycoprotein-N-acetylgalactosamine 3-beta-galactosyltransferase 1 n=1 Tax=Operophtera brumata TaxID=104452 RepID=A0A0L7L0B5_OPEBR|nr:Glycoprotein-N-acetylgalactosamine 3-beta-galactosyltransferase 1 [Operophtera brumata]
MADDAQVFAPRGLLSYYRCKLPTKSTITSEYFRDLNKLPIADVVEHGRDEPAHRNEDHSVADALAKKVRVLCWVMTQPKNHETKAKPVKATWGKRCNVLLFMSTQEDKSLNTIKLPVHEGRDYLWAKTKAAFRYVYEHHRRDADWVIITVL